MNNRIKIISIIIMSIILSTAYAKDRPTLQFDGKTYYLARSYNEVDNQFSPINVVELYFPVGETSDNYTKFVKRVTLLEVTDYKTSANARLHEYLEDNKHIPYEIMEGPEGQKVILKVTFWWPFRPTLVNKAIYVFQLD